MQFNFYPIKADMTEEFQKVLKARVKKLTKQIKFALGCRGEELNKDIWDTIFQEISEVTSAETEKLWASYCQMFGKVDAILGNHIA